MNSHVRLFLPAVALLSMASCALPPREAWRVVQRDGLLPYIAVEMGRRPVPPYVRLPATNSRFVTVTAASAKAPAAAVPGQAQAVRSAGVYVARSPSAIQSSRYLVVTSAEEERRAATAAAVPRPAPAHYTAPAAAALPKSVPAVPAASPKPVEKTVVKPVPRPAPRTSVTTLQPKPKPAPPPPPRPAPHPEKPSADELANVPRAKPMPPEPTTGEPVVTARPAAPSAPTSLPAVAQATPPPAKPTSGGNAPSPSPGKSVPTPKRPVSVPGELPFGTPIPGRPGLVNSPFAGKYQLVDVTGLNAGQEVKCPYTGKLFRVPGVQQAKDTSKPPLEAPPSPEKKTNGTKKP
ncbi:MAG: hypothetical protein K1X78_03340 [Verrucomicrobiaceae bacterium]|nr:hypothetical protein [Verrucomicrobiaceae bacterium]